MITDPRAFVAALQAAIEDERRHLHEPDLAYEMGYMDGLVRALDVVQATAHGLPSGAERRC
jgi:hypothetical protein